MSTEDAGWEQWEPFVPPLELSDCMNDADVDDSAPRRSTRQAFLRASAGGLLIASSLPAAAKSFGTASLSGAESPSAKAVKGGTLRLAIRGTTPAGMDPHKAVTQEEAARTLNLYDTLTELRPDSTVGLRLAETLEPNKQANVWDIRIRENATWHNGKPVRPEDIIYSLKRVLDPATGSTGKSSISSIDPKRLKKLDKRTVRVTLNRRNGDFPIGLTSYPVVMIPAGTNAFDNDANKPIGSGPFMFRSWELGRESTFVKNPRYWRPGWPIVDQLVIIDISNSDARINALLGGQVDLVQNVSVTRATQLRNGGQVRVLLQPNANARMITMAVDIPPYNDNRVRQALRLATNREQLVAVGIAGFGKPANDMYGKGQAFYNSTLPQRKYDPDRAKSLLKQAGKEGFTDTYYSSPDPTIAQLFIEQMRAIGVNLKVAIPAASDEFTIGPGYLKWPLAQTGYGATPISSFMDLAVAEAAPYNETHWHRPAFQKRLLQAQASTNFAVKKELFWSLGKELYDEGGYIQYANGYAINASSLKLSGTSVAGGDFTLGNFDMRRVHFIA